MVNTIFSEIIFSLNYHKHFETFKTILKFYLNCHSYNRIKLITKLRLGFIHLREHKFKHNFQDTPNPVCTCGITTRLLFIAYFIVKII